ncbi:MAG: type I DNA topoisomerase, partial [Atribacterota bacterium]
GPYGKYLACSKFSTKHPTMPYIERIGVPCPKNGCDGEIIRRKSKKNRIFFGCSRYPDCNFYSIHLPVNKKCPKCGSILVKINSKRKGSIYKCSAKECDFYEKVLKEKDEQIKK